MKIDPLNLKVRYCVTMVIEAHFVNDRNYDDFEIMSSETIRSETLDGLLETVLTKILSKLSDYVNVKRLKSTSIELVKKEILSLKERLNNGHASDIVSYGFNLEPYGIIPSHTEVTFENFYIELLPLDSLGNVISFTELPEYQTFLSNTKNDLVSFIDNSVTILDCLVVENETNLKTKQEQKEYETYKKLKEKYENTEWL